MEIYNTNLILTDMENSIITHIRCADSAMHGVNKIMSKQYFAGDML